jgi:hypothetical protein
LQHQGALDGKNSLLGYPEVFGRLVKKIQIKGNAKTKRGFLGI